ncbi:Fluconazole resistance protein 3 [Cytospora mali]|uniref:Fluconazole resistance protein 3 n=1 Tax=Cytospora mali TaxID=578113 RepID=A0A194WAE6_CYTMA|nr:Fluconazole resistance protein 3 [Valsa mali]
MDYSHDAYFAGAQPPYHQFPVGITPLTPSNSAGSENFNTSPQNTFDHCPSEQQYPGFGPYAAEFNPPSAFPGPPTPPNHPIVHNGQIHPQHGMEGAGALAFGHAQSDDLPMTKSEPNGEVETHTRQGSNSTEEDETTPAQTRRKAQNRAAQRAFRERKERHVKELEAKLATLEAAQQEAATENEKLKRDLQKISTENEILKATSSINGGGSLGGGATTTEPLEYNPTDFYTRVLAQHRNKVPCHRIVESENGERLYAAGATWDYIISHELFKQGLVDIADISNRLKHKAKCDGQGPVFEESTIIEAIEQSVGSGSDQLL